MELQGERLIPAPIAMTWDALNDPATLRACIAGCESLERTADDAFVAVVALKVGPVSARFKGSLKLSAVNPPVGYTINFDGQGGIAGFGKGSADVALEAIDEQTRLSYQARASVGGKMAQIGSRLIDATAAKITDDFFKAFAAQLQGRALAAPVALGALVIEAGAEAATAPTGPVDPAISGGPIGSVDPVGQVDPVRSVDSVNPVEGVAVTEATPAIAPEPAASETQPMSAALGWSLAAAALVMVYVVLR